eukprot:TRINITY_DN7730_c0_g1_i1.p2 TRINITY_DN7730_c0_g1~~TRINITY_DN7730_c0_g1_i1.p2  ORF type:complete len:94 (+),score=6.45 TRINITY_DN7730_c0_g1_i1:33-314(+)
MIQPANPEIDVLFCLFFSMHFSFDHWWLFYQAKNPEECVFQPSLEKDETGSYAMKIRPEPGLPDKDKTLCMVMTHYPNESGMSAVMSTWGDSL